MPKKVFIIIAAYNEEKSISKVILSLRKAGYKSIIVIDDGSSDNTTKAAEQAGARVLKHIINRGQGAALKTGIDYALQSGADVIVTFDADGQHDPKDIPSLIAPVLKHEVDVCLGNRFIGAGNKSNTPFLKKIFLKGGAFITSLMYGIRVKDTHNGFRAISRKAAQKINITEDRMEHAHEILKEIGAKKLKYREIPVNITYSEYSIAKGQGLKNSFKFLWNMIYDKLFK